MGGRYIKVLGTGPGCVETLDILLGALKVLNEESEALGLRVSWVKTKIQAFNDILDAAILSVPICYEDVEVTESHLPWQ